MWFLVRHPRLVRGPVRRWVSTGVWAYLEAQPGFNEGMRRAEAELAAGGGVRFHRDFRGDE